MNWRAVGCGTLAAVVFVGIGLLGMSMAFSGIDGCPDRLQWEESSYLPHGEPVASPGFPDGPAVEIGSTFIGLTTRRVWGPPGSLPAGGSGETSGLDKPQQLILDCADGTVREYRAELSGRAS